MFLDHEKRDRSLSNLCRGRNCLVILLAVAAGCAGNAIVVRDTENGGIVSYPFQTGADILGTTRGLSIDRRQMSQRFTHSTRGRNP